MRILVTFVIIFAMASSSAGALNLDKKDLPSKWKKWLNEEVVYIISEQERGIFLQLETEEQRERFAEKFWEVRDPTPGTSRNEYRDEHYSRLEYANKFLGRDSTRPGWMTDRGRMHIILGKPKQVQTYPSSGVIYPVELWFCQGDPSKGLPPFFYLLFHKRHGAGEYTLYDPMIDGPQSLLTNPTSSNELAYQQIYQYVNAEVAMASVNFLATEGTYDPRSPSLASTMLVAKIENVKNKNAKTDWAELILLGKEEIKTEYTFREGRLASVVFPFSDERGDGFIDFAFELAPGQISLGQYDEEIYGAYEIAVRLSDTEGLIIYSDSKNLEFKFDEKQFEAIKNRPLLYGDKLPCPEGRYNLSIQLRNKVTKEFNVISATVVVPSAPVDKPGASPLFLAGDFSQVKASDKYFVSPFQFSVARLLPSPALAFGKDKPLIAYCQLFLPPERRFESPGEVSINYSILTETGKEEFSFARKLSTSQYTELGIQHLFTQIPLKPIPPGQYTLVLKIDFGHPGEIFSRTADFEVVANALNPPVIHGGEGIILNSASVFLTRGKMWEHLGELQKATESYLAAVAADPKCIQCRLELASLLILTNKEEDALRALEPVAMAEPDNPRMLEASARAYFRMSSYSKAVKFLERLRRSEGDSPALLNFLGEALLLDGKNYRAKEVWERSLDLEPKQPEIRDKLSKLKDSQ